MDTRPRPGAAIVFPGMGPSSFADVARFMLVNPHARKLVAEADEVLGHSLADRYEQAEGDYSPYAQIAFVVNCLALARWAGERHGIEPQYVVGPSFGGRAAAVHAGVLSFPDAVRTTARLADCMDEYFAREHPDLVTHSFVRVPRERLDEMLAELTDRGEWHDVSCHVDDDFFMVTLSEKSLEPFQQRVRSVGGLSLYTMKPPMHSHVFGGLRDRVEREIFAGLSFADPVLPVVADQDGTVLTTGAGVRTMLLDGFVRPVRWPDVVASLREAGVGRLYVAGQDAMFTRVGCTTRAFEVVPFTPRAALQPARRSMPAAR
ncbi:ACP S-malonyltransferase [Streptomyces sp. NPDC006610]|jgi:[acyl-carrier-protein] S-malonyltransferase|uniref:ACP S-malonyltransferase n=1 Tax=Streptomyces sp. NPDC006610 TaxID=3154584 RepID=UPI0033A14D82